MRIVLKKVVDKIKTHFTLNKLFSKIMPLFEIIWEKYCRVGHATDDDMAHAHIMLNTQGYKYTLRTCNTYCFFLL